MGKEITWITFVYLWLCTAWRQRYLITVLLIALPLLALLAGLFKPSLYESKMTILIQETAKHNPFLEDLAVETRLKDRIAALDALLHSRHVLLGVAVDLKIVNDDTPVVDREEIVRKLSESLRLRLIGDELIELSYRQSSKENIDRALLAIAQRFLEKILGPERSAIAGSVTFLQEQLSKSESELSIAEEQLAVFLSENAESLPELHPGKVKRLAEMKLALSEKRTALEGARANYSVLRRHLAKANPIVAKIETKIVQLTAELAGLQARYTEKHTSVAATRRELRRLQAERKAMLQTAPQIDESDIEGMWTAALQTSETESGLQQLLVSQVERLQESKVRVVDLERQTNALTEEVQLLDASIAKFGLIEQKLGRFKRDVDVKRDVHEKLMKRSEMARVTGALGRFEAPERVKVIDQPAIPASPSGPTPIAFLFAGIVAALLASISVVVVSELMDTTVRRSEEAQQITGIPVITRVPRLEPIQLPEAILVSGFLLK